MYYYKTPNEFSTEEKSRMLLKEISKLFNTTNEELDIDGFTKMLVRISNLKTIYDQIKDNSIYNRITDITRKISPSKKNLFYPILYYFYENAVANEEQKEIIVKCCFWAACEYIHGGQGDSQTKRTFFERIHKYFATKNFSEIYKINIDISIDSFKNYAKDD
ncbi:MAG: hypothetical protein LBB45_03790 [Methanobrevibacter sp.]|nr:hypothetical protein [Candidatus Methanovirga basalitermitum]